MYRFEVPIRVSLIRVDVFDIDLTAGELRKQGVKTRLQEQPFQILAVLLERPGQVVTRDELQKRLWNADTFVDFDRGLNKAINRVREALDDSADPALRRDTAQARVPFHCTNRIRGRGAASRAADDLVRLFTRRRYASRACGTRLAKRWTSCQSEMAAILRTSRICIRIGTAVLRGARIHFSAVFRVVLPFEFCVVARRDTAGLRRCGP
jgi:hypothetical protein